MQQAATPTFSARWGTRIVATLGPASAAPDTIRGMVEAGLDVVRLNFSHGDHATMARWYADVRAAQNAAGKPLAVIADLQGPKIRLGDLLTPRPLLAGSSLRIVTDRDSARDGAVVCDYDQLPAEVRPGDQIFVKDGEIELEVHAVEPGVIETVVVTGGTLTSRAGVNVPGISLRVEAITAKDREDIRFACKLGVDYLALSFVRSAADVVMAREIVEEIGADVGILAKIETALALERLDAIVEAADGVMVARGDLGVEVGPENVPIWQRRIIQAAGRKLVPVITATQMLESMVENARPTRAEASDVANAVWDGTDAVMLSAETAVGAHPVESVAMMARIITRAEAEDAGRMPRFMAPEWAADPSRNISLATRDIIDRKADVRGVIAFTMGGYTARLVAKDRMPVPVVVLAADARVEQRAALLWGVRPVRCPPPQTFEEMLAAVERSARDVLGCDTGDTVVVVAGLPLGQGVPTNFLKLHTLAG